MIYLLDLDLTFERYNMKVDFRPMKCVPGDKKKKQKKEFRSPS